MTTAPENNIDPNVSIPPAVRAAAARSEELMRQSLAPKETPKEASEENQEQPESDATPPESERTFETKPQQTSQQDVNWEHRYNSMKGRFEREAQARQQLSHQLGEMQRQIAELQNARPAPSDVQFDRLITPEEERDYGPEFLSVVGKKAKEEVSPEIARLEAEIARLKGQVSGVNSVVEMSAREKLEAHLDQEVPNWRELNTNPEFISWLDLPDVFSGAIRKQLLHAAYFRHDASRVAAFFKGFISDEAATNPANAGAGHGITQEGNKPNKVPLEAFAAPGRAKTTAAPAPVEKPFFTRAQIAQFYSSVQRGEFAGRESEKQKLEDAIFAAQREGRIR